MSERGASKELHFKFQLESPGDLTDPVIAELLQLPSEIRPTHYGLTERPRRSPESSLNDMPRTRRFLDAHGTWFWLYGSRLTYEFMRTTWGGLSWRVVGLETDTRFTRFGDTIVQLMDNFHATHGLGACWNEYESRHGYQIDFIDGGCEQDLCGRDFHRYVPGLYWMNYFSNAYCEAMQIDVPALVKALDGDVLKMRSGIRLRLYDKPTDWKLHASKVADVIHETKGFFSIRNVVIPTHLSKFEDSDAASPSTVWP